jgi:hypothetical protein
VRSDTILGLECRKLLGIGRKAGILSSEEHEYAPLRREPALQALEAIPDTALARSGMILGLPIAAGGLHSRRPLADGLGLSRQGESAFLQSVANDVKRLTAIKPRRHRAANP